MPRLSLTFGSRQRIWCDHPSMGLVTNSLWESRPCFDLFAMAHVVTRGISYWNLVGNCYPHFSSIRRVRIVSPFAVMWNHWIMSVICLISMTSSCHSYIMSHQFFFKFILAIVTLVLQSQYLSHIYKAHIYIYIYTCVYIYTQICTQ